MKINIFVNCLFCLMLFQNITVHAQNHITDSLCHSLDGLEDWQLHTYNYKSHRSFVEHPTNLYLYSTTDSTKPLNRIYMQDGKDSILTGWYDYMIRTYILTGDAASIQSDLTFVTVICYFNDGVPCCEWKYTQKWHYTDTEYIKKIETYDNGLLNGNYVVYTNKGDTLYQTVFHQGTGYYQDYFPDGTVRIQGRLVKGYRDGVWMHYLYQNKKYEEITIEKYENGELITTDTFNSATIYNELKNGKKKKR